MTTQPQSQPVDYRSGVEAMVLAILQQTQLSLNRQQVQILALQIDFLSAQDSSALSAQWTALYAAYLADALADNSNLTSTIQSHMLHLSSSESLLPVRSTFSAVWSFVHLEQLLCVTRQRCRCGNFLLGTNIVQYQCWTHFQYHMT